MFEQYRCIPVIWSWGICCPGHQEQNGSQEQIKAVWQGTATWVGEDKNLILSREGPHSREPSCTLLKGTKEPGLTTSPSTQHTINTNTFCFCTSCSLGSCCDLWVTGPRQAHPEGLCTDKDTHLQQHVMGKREGSLQGLAWQVHATHPLPPHCTSIREAIAFSPCRCCYDFPSGLEASVGALLWHV